MGVLRDQSTPGLLPHSSNESQLCWASNQEKRDRTRDKIKDEKGAGSEIRTQRKEVKTTQSSGTGALGWKPCSRLARPRGVAYMTDQQEEQPAYEHKHACVRAHTWTWTQTDKVFPERERVSPESQTHCEWHPSSGLQIYLEEGPLHTPGHTSASSQKHSRRLTWESEASVWEDAWRELGVASKHRHHCFERHVTPTPVSKSPVA